MRTGRPQTTVATNQSVTSSLFVKKRLFLSTVSKLLLYYSTLRIVAVVQRKYKYRPVKVNNVNKHY